MTDWHFWLLAASVLVLAGVTVESYKLFRDFRRVERKRAWPKAGVGLLLVGLALAVFFQSRIEYQDAALQRDADLKMASLAAEARSAESKIAAANQAVAQANQRAAQAAKDAAVAGEHAAEIERAAAWRQLTAEQKDKMQQILSRVPATVQVSWIGNDPESLYLAGQIIDVFKTAHWTVWISAKTYSSSLIFSLIVPPINKAGVTASVEGALSAAGIAFSSLAVPPADSESSDGIPPPEAAVLLIGSRRPTFAQTPQ